MVRESSDHRIAKGIVTLYLRTKYPSREVYEEYFFSFPEIFCKKHKFKPTQFKGHSYDIVLFNKQIAVTLPVELVVEIDGNVDYNYGYIKGARTRHSNREQKENDGVAMDYIESRYPYAKFIRLLKEEINNFHSCYEYLEENIPSL